MDGFILRDSTVNTMDYIYQRRYSCCEIGQHNELFYFKRILKILDQ